MSKKANQNITSIPESWMVMEGENNGNVMLVRKNDGLQKIAGNSLYSTSCGIALKLISPNKQGLPEKKEEKDLYSLEDEIFETYESDLTAIVSLIITTSGFREFVLYTKDAAEFNARLKTLKEKYPQYQLTSYVKVDVNWDTYHSF